MATGFKTAQINASMVPATQSNFPAYIDLSRLGITTLAEAQSVRVYSDSGKTTELAREIVSASECHCKIPSLTSTTDIYVEWDGVSPDYAATDTYGRNAVWSAYRAVYHLESLTSDSTSNAYTLTNTNTVGSAATLINNGADFGTANTNKRLNTTSNLGIDGGDISIAGWIKLRTEISDGGFWSLLEQRGGSTDVVYRLDYARSGSTYTIGANRGRNGVTDNYVTTTGALGTSTWHHLVLTYDGTLRLYLDGSTVGTPLVTSGSGSGLANAFCIGATGNGFLFSSIYADEVSVISSASSANWITTQYNNQSDEATFWGSWSTVGGGSTFVPKVQWLS